MGRKPKQSVLLDNSNPEDEALVKLAEAYEEVRDDRMAALAAEVKASAALLDKMPGDACKEVRSASLAVEIRSEEATEKVEVDRCW